jgi:hypothetical protein
VGLEKGLGTVRLLPEASGQPPGQTLGSHWAAFVSLRPQWTDHPVRWQKRPTQCEMSLHVALDLVYVQVYQCRCNELVYILISVHVMLSTFL